MAKYDQRNQNVNTQYNAARDINIFDTSARGLKKELTEAEKELLVCTYRGGGEILRLSGAAIRTYWVCAGDKQFIDKNAPDSDASNIYAKKYYAALQSLRGRRYVDRVNSWVYELNYAGIQKTEELVKAEASIE